MAEFLYKEALNPISMRVTLVTVMLVLATACSWERTLVTRPEPQKSALRQCNPVQTMSCGPPPLLIVDGKRMDFMLTDLENLQIEQVEVIKGPTAIAYYGEDARYGAIVIKSRRLMK